MWMCEDCHAQLHLLFTNNELRDCLNTPEAVLNDEKIQKFGRYASKQFSHIKKKESNKRKKSR